MLNVWSLSVRRRRNDPPDHFLTLLHREFACSFNDNPILAHQTPDTVVTDINAYLFRLFGHPRAATAAQAQARLLLDMGQNHHVDVLPAAGRAAVKGPQPAWADVHHMAQPVGRERPNMFFNEPEPHGFRLAKIWVAFFRMSLSSRSMRFSRRSRSF